MNGAETRACAPRLVYGAWEERVRWITEVLVGWRGTNASIEQSEIRATRTWDVCWASRKEVKEKRAVFFWRGRGERKGD